MQIKRFIEENFLIDDPVTGQYVPFRFRPVQAKYYDALCEDYKSGFEGVREIILKARKEGFTSLILAIFAAKMILEKNPMTFLEISYKEDATRQHFRKLKNYILSFYEKNPSKWTLALERYAFKSQSEGSELVLSQNGASFYVGTANVRTGERGGTVQGILFSEAAHYPDTGIITAREIIESARNMVAVNSGMIFQESTANGFNHFKITWDMARRGEVDYKPRFFSWRDYYSEAQFEDIKSGFTDKTLIAQEYPENEIDAFLKDSAMAIIPASVVLKCVGARFPKAGDIKRITVADIGGDGVSKDADETVIYNFTGQGVESQEIYKHVGLMDTVGRIMSKAKKHGSNLICVDKVGEGSGVFSRLEEVYSGDYRMDIYGFDGRVSAPDGLDAETYANYKSYAWFNAANNFFKEQKICVPDDPVLISELSAMTYKFRSGRRACQDKDKVCEMLGHSPNRADAFIMGLDALSKAKPLVKSLSDKKRGQWEHPAYIASGR